MAQRPTLPTIMYVHNLGHLIRSKSKLDPSSSTTSASSNDSSSSHLATVPAATTTTTADAQSTPPNPSRISTARSGHGRTTSTDSTHNVPTLMLTPSDGAPSSALASPPSPIPSLDEVDALSTASSPSPPGSPSPCHRSCYHLVSPQRS